MDASIEAIRNAAANVSAGAAAITQHIARSKTPDTIIEQFYSFQPHPGVTVGTLVEGMERLSAILSSIEAATFPLPPSIVSSVVNQCTAVNNSAKQLVNEIQNQVASNGPITGFESSGHFIYQNGNMGSFAGTAADLYSQYEGLVRNTGAVLPLLELRRSRRGTPANWVLGATIRVAEKQAAQISEMLDQAERHSESIKSNAGTSDGLSSELRNLSAQLIDRQKKLEAVLEHLETLVKEANEAHNDVMATKARTADVSTEIEDFERLIKDRDEQIATQNREASAIKERLSEQVAEVEMLSTRAEEMINGATVAGLASSFGDVRDKLEGELKWAQRWVVGSVAVILLLSIPLVWQIVEPIASWLRPPIVPAGLEKAPIIVLKHEPPAPITSWESLVVYVVSRFSLLLPGIILIVFTIKRYNALFQLRESYAHKYSMAMSVSGFKKQAPLYEQEIAAMTLEQMAVNPGDMLNSDRRRLLRTPRMMSAFYEKIMDSLAKRLAKDADKLGDK